MNRADIEGLLPHRGVMLLLDRVIEIQPGQSIVAEHDVDGDDPWFPGHFPGNAILPGVLVAEALAQAAGVAYLSGHRESAGATVYLVGMDKMRFRRPVRPGDTLRLKVTLEREKRQIVWFDVEATVGGDRVANGSLMATLARENA